MSSDWDGSTVIIDSYGPVLDADFVQISHHGYGDVYAKLYEYINAEYALWTQSYSSFLDHSLEPACNLNDDDFDTEKELLYYQAHTVVTEDESTKTFVLPFDLKFGEIIYDNIPLE